MVLLVKKDQHVSTDGLAKSCVGDLLRLKPGIAIGQDDRHANTPEPSQELQSAGIDELGKRRLVQKQTQAVDRLWVFTLEPQPLESNRNADRPEIHPDLLVDLPEAPFDSVSSLASEDGLQVLLHPVV